MYIKELNTYVFVEQAKYNLNSISTNIKNIIEKHYIIKTKGNDIWFNSTGFFLCNDIILIIFPKGYVLDNNSESKDQIIVDSRLLLSVLMKYQKDSALQPEEMRLIGGGAGNKTSSLFTAYTLIEDYKAYGLLKRNMKTITTQYSGNTNWNKTVSKKNPIFSNIYPIYYDALYNKNKHDENNLLICLHKFAIYKSIEKFGWILGIDKCDFVEYKTELPCELTKGLHFLENELRKTFISREIEVIKNIIHTLLDNDSQDFSSSIEMLLTNSFYYVWEAICSKIFKNQYSKLKALLPQPIWEFENTDKHQSISHRPDILLIRNNLLYILDAKHYDVDTNLPGWHDAVKQFFYRLSLKKHIENNRNLIADEDLKYKAANITDYKNAFILPSFTHHEIRKLGSIKVPNVSEYGQIDAFTVDAILAMKCYIGEDEYSFINRIEAFY